MISNGGYAHDMTLLDYIAIHTDCETIVRYSYQNDYKNVDDNEIDKRINYAKDMINKLKGVK